MEGQVHKYCNSNPREESNNLEVPQILYTTVRYYTCTRSLCRETSGVLLAHVCPTCIDEAFSSIMSQRIEMSKAGYICW